MVLSPEATTKLELPFTTVAVPPNQAASVYLTLYLALSEVVPPKEEENFKCVSKAVVIELTFTEAASVDVFETI